MSRIKGDVIMAKLQVNGFATIAKSKELPQEVKDQVLSCEGKNTHKAIRCKMTDAEGNDVIIGGKLITSSVGSLMARMAFKLNSFELVEIDNPKLVKKGEDKEQKKADKVKASAEALAAELLA
jgi:hypothetical protein